MPLYGFGGVQSLVAGPSIGFAKSNPICRVDQVRLPIDPINGIAGKKNRIRPPVERQDIPGPNETAPLGFFAQELIELATA